MMSFKVGDKVRLCQEYYEAKAAWALSRGFSHGTTLEDFVNISLRIAQIKPTKSGTYFTSLYRAEKGGKKPNIGLTLEMDKFANVLVSQKPFCALRLDEPLLAKTSLYCSCGGLTKKVAAGIGPGAGCYDFCTVCKKERL